MLSTCVRSLHRLSLLGPTARPMLAAGSLLVPAVPGDRYQPLHTTQSVEAARKGTREKARKKKVKVEVKKIGFIPHNQRGKDK